MPMGFVYDQKPSAATLAPHAHQAENRFRVRCILPLVRHRSGCAGAGLAAAEHLTQKYGSTPAQQAQIRETIRQRGADVGFTFSLEGRGRIYNTFHAHRLLHWVGEVGPTPQRALKMALLQACHGHRRAMDDEAVLLDAVKQAGLDVEQAQAILASEAFAQEVREREAFYTSHGIHAVPAVIINNRHLISGGQPAAVFEQALRQIAAEPEPDGA
jgi:predicted DsbA family dithiol-disulfide isomerase